MRASSIPVLRSGLGENVTERRKDHVVDGLGLRTNVGEDSGIPTPSILGDVGILNAPLKRAAVAFVEAVPEANRPFLNVAQVGVAGASTARCSSTSRQNFRVAPGVIVERRAIAHAGSGGCADGRGVIPSAERILETIVEVNVQLGSRVKLNGGKCGSATNRGKRAVRPHRHVRKLRRAVASMPSPPMK